MVQIPSEDEARTLSLLVPFVTFVLGFLASGLTRWFERRRRLGNVKQMLLNELIEWHEWSRKLAASDDLGATKALAEAMQALRLDAYTHYFGDLCDLPGRTFAPVLEAYAHVRQLESQVRSLGDDESLRYVAADRLRPVASAALAHVADGITALGGSPV